MKHFKIIILIILFLFNHKSYANENIVEILKKNNNIIFIRHSLAPGSGDPENINLKDCKTQRNLYREGIKQSKKIGNFFKKNNIELNRFFRASGADVRILLFMHSRVLKHLMHLTPFTVKNFMKIKINK